MKKITIFIVLLAISGTLGYRLWFANKETQHQRPAPLVELVVVNTYEMNDKVEALGNIFADESVDITANITEIIREIHFKDGDSVTKGTVLAILEQSEEQAQLAAAKAQLEEHIREKKRLKGLLKGRAATEKSYDERVTLIEITQRIIEEIQARIDDRTIKAPFDGILGIRQISAGALIQPGQIITTIDDIDPVKLDFNVPATFLATLKKGTSIKAKSEALKEKIFDGHIETINTRVDPITRSVLARAVIQNPDSELKPGLLMQVDLLQNKRQSIVVPEETLIMRQDKHYVYKVDADNTIRQIEVTIGTRRPGEVEILEGLSIGEKIVVRGVNYIREGQKVNIKHVWETNQNPDN